MCFDHIIFYAVATQLQVLLSGHLPLRRTFFFLVWSDLIKDKNCVTKEQHFELTICYLSEKDGKSSLKRTKGIHDYAKEYVRLIQPKTRRLVVHLSNQIAWIIFC